MPIYEEKEKVNGQKRYYIRTYVTDEFGKKKQVTKHNKDWVGRDGYWLAHAEENILKSRIVNNNNNITLSELSKSYLKELSYNSKLGTIKKHADNINKYILPYFPNVKANCITNEAILEWKQKINSKPFSLNFKKGIFVSFSAMLNHGCLFYNINCNPVRNVGNFKSKKGNRKKEMNIMGEKQFSDFIENESNELYKIAFTTLFYTGMRRGELLALEWNDINFSENTIIISKTLNPKLIDESDNSPKTDKSNRTIQMAFIVHDCLKRLKEIRNELDPFSFIKLTTFKRRCDNNCKQIGIENFRIHDFRHSFASMCIDKEIPIHIISDYMGHENISTTLDTYSHLYSHSQNKLLDKLNENFL